MNEWKVADIKSVYLRITDHEIVRNLIFFFFFHFLKMFPFLSFFLIYKII